jgi:hypothetical protein
MGCAFGQSNKNNQRRMSLVLKQALAEGEVGYFKG